MPSHLRRCARLACLLAVPVLASAQNARGSATGPTTAKGFDHPDQFAAIQDVKPADNMYPVVPHPEQDREARAKLAALEKRFGKKPNVLDLPDGRRRLDGPRLQRRRDRGRQRDAGDGPARGERHQLHLGLLHAFLLAVPGHHPHRPEPPPPRHPAPAHVRRARRARRGHHLALPAPEARLRDAGRGQVAHGREPGLPPAERRLRRLTSASWASRTCTRNGATSTSTPRWPCRPVASPRWRRRASATTRSTARRGTGRAARASGPSTSPRSRSSTSTGWR